MRCLRLGTAIISDDLSFFLIIFFLSDDLSFFLMIFFSDDLSFLCSFFFKNSNVKYSTSAPILSYAWKPDKFVKDAATREIEFSAILQTASNSMQFPQKTENSYLLLWRWIGLPFLHKFGQLRKWKGIFFLVVDEFF